MEPDWNVGEFRSKRIKAKTAQNQKRSDMVKSLKRIGHTNVAIAQKLGVSESTVRTILKSQD
jgi:transposase